MNDNTNPFKELETDDPCPPALRDEIIAEIDLMRNALMAADVYTHNTFAVLSAFMNGLLPAEEK